MTGRTGSVRVVVLDIHVRGSGVQLDVDVELTADAGWDMTGDCDVWRAQLPISVQAVQ